MTPITPNPTGRKVNEMASFLIFPVYVEPARGGFVAFIAPLDGGMQVLARSMCPLRARTLALEALQDLDTISNKRSAVA